MSLRELLTSVYREMKRDNAFDGAAVLAYYLTLAIFPATIALLAVTPYLPIARVDQAIMDLMREALPLRAAEMFAGVVHQVASERRGGLLTFGVAAAYWSASNGMYAVMRQLNAAFNVKEGRPFLRARATALLLSLLFGVLVLGGFSLIVLGGVIQAWIGDRYGFSDALLAFFVVFRWLVIVLSLLLAISLIYYLAPNRARRFRLFTAGSVAATALLVVASYAFSLYTSHFGNYSAVYGSIGAMVLLMLWLYIAGLVILAGAEVDEVLEQRRRADDQRRR
ncbi:MAG: YihY/virulence factor BrkB family protein [Rudaea sp.]